MKTSENTNKMAIAERLVYDQPGFGANGIHDPTMGNAIDPRAKSIG